MVRNFMQADCPRCGHPRQGTHRTEGCKADDEVVEALREFKRANGVRWKSRLRELWLSGRDEGALRRARNVIGPGGRRLEKVERGMNL